jgi:hypothetical protein
MKKTLWIIVTVLLLLPRCLLAETNEIIDEENYPLTWKRLNRTIKGRIFFNTVKSSATPFNYKIILNAQEYLSVFGKLQKSEFIPGKEAVLIIQPSLSDEQYDIKQIARTITERKIGPDIEENEFEYYPEISTHYDSKLAITLKLVGDKGKNQKAQTFIIKFPLHQGLNLQTIPTLKIES